MLASLRLGFSPRRCSPLLGVQKQDREPNYDSLSLSIPDNLRGLTGTKPMEHDISDKRLTIAIIARLVHHAYIQAISYGTLYPKRTDKK